MTRRIAVPLLAAALALAAGLSALAAPSPPQLTLPCDHIIGRASSGDANGYRVVLGVVSVPPAFLEQVVPSGVRPWTYWRKAGLVVSSRARPVDVIVPVRWRRRLAITAGNRPGYLHALR